MKKLILLTISTLIFSGISNAQGALDALRYSQYQYEGTAKSMAMGNAVTSLGGDIYSISINPAASAVYRHSEFSFTPSFNIINNTASYTDSDIKKNAFKANLSSIGYVGSIKMSKWSAVRNVNFGIAYNVLNNYNNEYTVSGRTAESSWLGSLAWYTNGLTAAHLDEDAGWNNAPWKSILAWDTGLIERLNNSEYLGATENINNSIISLAGPLNQRFVRKTTGSLADILFNAGVNILDKLYLGANLTMQTLYYSDSQRYSEWTNDPSLFHTGFSEFSHLYRQTTAGVGVNMKFGAIITPISGLRIATSISTPTWMYLHDEWDESINSAFSNGNTSRSSSPLGEYDYRINTPFRWNLGVSYVIGNIGIISADYENVNYTNISMKDDNGDDHEFREDNAYIENYFKNSSIYRLGAEIRPVKNLALRAGYSFYTNSGTDFRAVEEKKTYTNPETNLGDRSYVSAGIGFSNGKSFFADLGVQKMLNHEGDFFLYNDYNIPSDTIPGGKYTLKQSPLKVLLTIGFRF